MTDEQIEILTRLVSNILDEIRLQREHHWYCGCGHWNGANLATCAECGRKPGE